MIINYTPKYSKTDFPMMFILQKLTGYHYWSSNEGELGRERREVLKAITADGDFYMKLRHYSCSWKKATKI